MNNDQQPISNSDTWHTREFDEAHEVADEHYGGTPWVFQKTWKPDGVFIEGFVVVFVVFSVEVKAEQQPLWN